MRIELYQDRGNSETVTYLLISDFDEKTQDWTQHLLALLESGVIFAILVHRHTGTKIADATPTIL